MSGSYEVKDKWSISHWNYCDALKRQLKLVPDIAIHNQTLRDGYQFSGVEFSPQECVEIDVRPGQIGVHRPSVRCSFTAGRRVDRSRKL